VTGRSLAGDVARLLLIILVAASALAHTAKGDL
jgi:hypothetical protein